MCLLLLLLQARKDAEAAERAEETRYAAQEAAAAALRAAAMHAEAAKRRTLGVTHGAQLRAQAAAAAQAHRLREVDMSAPERAVNRGILQQLEADPALRARIEARIRGGVTKAGHCACGRTLSSRGTL
jgi:hypothetical protein